MTKKFEIRNSTAEFLTFVAANKEEVCKSFTKTRPSGQHESW